MAIGGAFLGGGVEVVPAGSCKLELEILTEDRANLTATFTIKGTSTYTVTAGADGRAVYTVPAGQTYTVSVNTTGYDNIASQTVIAESGTVRYVRFEAIAGRVKRSGDTMTGTLAVVGGASIDTNGQVIGKKLRATADIHLGSSPSSYAVINDGWIQNRTLDETKADLGVTGKQDKLTAGTNITISGTTISAKDTTYDVATQSANGLMSSTDKTKLDGVDSALAGKVSKSGDTITGEMTTMKSGWIVRTYKSTDVDATALTTADNRPYYLRALDKNNKVIGQDVIFTLSSRVMRELKINYYNSDGTVAGSSYLTMRVDPDGSGYVTTPSWSVGTNDNSDKVLTIKMANSLPSLVHTTGNETIAGTKIFTASEVISKANDRDRTAKTGNGNGWGYAIYDKNLNKVSAFYNEMTPESSATALYALAEDNNGQLIYDSLKIIVKTDRTSYATAPTTPINAVGNEIATANWAYDKFQRKITYGTGDPPSGGQAGDIYIKI